MFCHNDDWMDFGFGVWGGPRGKRRRRGRRFRWKMFERGDLKFVILRLISEKPMHGYEVMQALEKESMGTYRASAGSVYPTLQMLEDEGHLTSDQKNGKKVYSITDEGREYLEHNRDVVDEVFDRVSHFTDRFFGEEMRDLSATLSKLAQTTFEQAMRGVGPAVLEEMNTILEEALNAMRKTGRGSRRRSPGREEEGGAAAEEGKSADDEEGAS